MTAVEDTRAATSKPEHVWGPGKAPSHVWLLTAAFVLLTATWSLLTPQFLAPDESAHFSSVMRVSEGFSWPDPGTARFPAAAEAAGAEARTEHSERSTVADLVAKYPGEGERFDQMTQHPPLYYLLAGFLFAMPTVEDLVWDQAMFLVRLLGALLAAPLVWLTWHGVATLLQSRRIGSVAAIAIFGVPQLPQTMGVTTNDSLAILSAWTVTWLAIRVIKGDHRLRMFVTLGVAFGLGCLVKGTVLPLGLLLVLAPLVGDAAPARWRQRVLHAALALGVAFVVGGWWWLRNLILFRTLQPDGLVLDDPGLPPVGGPSLGHYIDEVWRTTPTTFWGWFGRVNVPLPNLVVDVLTITCLLLLIVGVFRAQALRLHALVLLAPVATASLLFVRTSWAAYAETGEVRGLHGRYFFTVLLALVALAALAARNVVRDRSARLVLAGAVAAAATALAVGGPAVAFLGFYAGNAYGAWRAGLSKWLEEYAPVSETAALLVPGAFAVAFAASIILIGTDLLRSATAVSWAWPNKAPLASGDTDIR